IKCTVAGMGADNDGDGLIDEDGFAPGAAAVGAPESFPSQCHGFVDDDGDGVINDGCPAVDDDNDGAFNEDAAFLLPTVCVVNNVTVADPSGHISDPNTANNTSSPSCQTLLLERPFTPSFVAIQDDGQNPSDPGLTYGPNPSAPLSSGTPPVDDDCLLSQPCEQEFYYKVPGDAATGYGCRSGTQGGCQPLAGVFTNIPGNGAP